MKTALRLLLPTLTASALTVAFPARAQSAADVMKELEALKARIAQLEAQLKAQQQAVQAAPAPAAAPAGMTEDQQRELNRITVKAEALEDSRDAMGLKLLKIGGYFDPTFIWNKAGNRHGFQFLSNVGSDPYSYDSSYFGTVAIDFQKETDSGTKWRLTLSPNRGTDAVMGNGGVVHEASVSIPLTDLQTRFIAGHIPDWSGYEYLQPTLNKLITHNLLFDFTLPTTYTGAGMEITSGKWIVKGLLANMNAARNREGNKGEVLAYRVDYARGEFQGFGFAGVHGKGTNFNECADTGCTGYRQSPLNLFEIDGYFIRGDWTVQGQLSFGEQKRASIIPAADGSLRDARWVGASALAAYKFTPRLEGIVRGDWLQNKKNGGGLLGYTLADGRNGIGPDATLGCDPADLTTLGADCDRGASRKALSFGLSWLLNSSTTVKAEYRLDRANLPVFLDVRTGEYRKSNQLFGTAVVVQF